MEYTILSLECKNNSVYGNPRYEIYYKDTEGDFGHATTQSDASFCYGITNDIYRDNDCRVMAELTFTRAGRVSNYKMTKKLWNRDNL